MSGGRERLLVTLSVDELREVVRNEVRAALASQPALTPTVFSTKEAAQILGVSDKTVGRAIRAGELEAARVGKGYRVTRAAITAYLERRAVEGGPMDSLRAAMGRLDDAEEAA